MSGRTWSWTRLLLAAFVVGCSGGEEESLRKGLESLSDDTIGTPVPAVRDPEAGQSASIPAPYPSPVARDTAPWAPEAQALAAPAWTSGTVFVQRAGVRMTTLRNVRFARHDDFDRLVLAFEGAEMPGYRVEYLREPGRQCGSGDEVDVDGRVRLQIRLFPAQAHDDGGSATLRERSFEPDLENVREVKLICDFEGQVEWLVGLRAANEYRVMELPDPTRLVIDVRHD